MKVFCIIVKIFVKVVYFLSKFAQIFSRTRPKWKLNIRYDRLEKTDEVVDIQEEINSSYDELLFTRLEEYFDSSVTVEPVTDETVFDDELSDCFGGFEGVKADKVLSAFQRVEDMRSRYNIPDDISDTDVIAFVRRSAERLKNEGGEANETQTQSVDAQSE